MSRRQGGDARGPGAAPWAQSVLPLTREATRLALPPSAAGPPCSLPQLWGLQGDPGVPGPPVPRPPPLRVWLAAVLARERQEAGFSVLPTLTRLSGSSGDPGYYLQSRELLDFRAEGGRGVSADGEAKGSLCSPMREPQSASVPQPCPDLRKG